MIYSNAFTRWATGGLSLLVFLLSPILSIPFIFQELYNKKRIGIITLSLFIGILTYLFLPSVIADGARRYYLYEDFESMNEVYFWSVYIVHRADYIFYIPMYYFAQWGIKWQYLLFIYGAFNIGVPLYLFTKYIDKFKLSSKNYLLCIILILFSTSITFLFSGIRQLIAFNLVSLAIYFQFFKNSNVKSLLLMIIAIMTHFSTFIYLPIILVFKYLNSKLILALILIFIFISFIIPDNLIENIFLLIDLGDGIYSEKVESYSNTSLRREESTNLVLLAKFLKGFWFYPALLYSLIIKNKSTLYFRLYLLSLLPVALFYAFPTISGRYKHLVQYYFTILLISQYVKTRRNLPLLLFMVLYSLAPIYDTFWLMWSSFVKGWIRFDNLTLVQIFLQEYRYEDMLP